MPIGDLIRRILGAGGRPEPPANAPMQGGWVTDQLPAQPAEGPKPPPHYGPFDFYGKRVGMLKLFGQKRLGDASPGDVTGAKIYHAAGVLVDVQDHIYVADTGNNRILAFAKYGDELPAFVIGQPDMSCSAANGDCNIGMYGPARADSLCLTSFPAGTNVAEQWMRVNFDTDSSGNLYFPDFYNNRVLRYPNPFAQHATQPGAPILPDLVLGQADFSGNQPNRGMQQGQRDASSLHISMGGFDHVSCRGVSVDADGAIWVADTFNHRVLRFPRNATEADLVLGQRNAFVAEPVPDIARAPLDRMCHPTVARRNPETGELWVVDEYPGGFPARILVFAPPFENGMAATRVIVPRQELRGDFAQGYRFSHCTGMQFNRFVADDFADARKLYRYRDGVVWIQEAGNGHPRVLLLNNAGEIILAIGAPDTCTYGCSDQAMRSAGLNEAAGFTMRWPGGNIGFDSQNNIYLCDDRWHRIARFQLPYQQTLNLGPSILPRDNGGLFAGMQPNSTGSATFAPDRFGLFTHGNQLVVRDDRRFMVWNDYPAKPHGADADLFVGQPHGRTTSQNNNIMGRSNHAITNNGQMWCTGEHGRLMAWQLPFSAGSAPLKTMIALYWADAPDTQVDYFADQALAFDTRRGHLWFFDQRHHRLLRVRNPGEVNGRLLVDCVLGQANKTDGALNRGMSHPDAASFGRVDSARFDRHGNLFVVDNTYEGHPNGRVIAFAAHDLDAINTMCPMLSARWLYCVDSFTTTERCRVHAPFDHPFSPVSVAFNSRNEMVIGNDGYYRDPKTRAIRQLYLYRDPLRKSTPDAHIELPMGAPGDLWFDDADNLVVQDHTWNRVWVINYDTDPVWLRPIP